MVDLNTKGILKGIITNQKKRKDNWIKFITQKLQSQKNNKYYPLHNSILLGLLTCVFIKDKLASKINNVKSDNIRVD